MDGRLPKTLGQQNLLLLLLRFLDGKCSWKNATMKFAAELDFWNLQMTLSPKRIFSVFSLLSRNKMMIYILL